MSPVYIGVVSVPVLFSCSVFFTAFLQMVNIFSIYGKAVYRTVAHHQEKKDF